MGVALSSASESSSKGGAKRRRQHLGISEQQLGRHRSAPIDWMVLGPHPSD